MNSSKYQSKVLHNSLRLFAKNRSRIFPFQHANTPEHTSESTTEDEEFQGKTQDDVNSYAKGKTTNTTVGREKHPCGHIPPLHTVI